MEKERRKMERIDDVVSRNRALIDAEIKKSSETRKQIEAQVERIKQLAFIRCPNDPGLVQIIHKLIERAQAGVSIDVLREAIVRCGSGNGNGCHAAQSVLPQNP